MAIVTIEDIARRERLGALAPELLVALCVLTERCDAMADATNNAGCDEALNTARAVIAKAEQAAI